METVMTTHMEDAIDNKMAETPFDTVPAHPASVPWEEYQAVKESYYMMCQMYDCVAQASQCSDEFIHWMNLDRMYNVFQAMYEQADGDLNIYDYELV